MRESIRQLLVPGIFFLVLGTLLFFVSEQITVKVEVMPFSLMLIMVMVAGAIMFGVGILSYFADKF